MEETPTTSKRARQIQEGGVIIEEEIPLTREEVLSLAKNNRFPQFIQNFRPATLEKDVPNNFTTVAELNQFDSVLYVNGVQYRKEDNPHQLDLNTQIIDELTH